MNVSSLEETRVGRHAVAGRESDDVPGDEVAPANLAPGSSAEGGRRRRHGVAQPDTGPAALIGFLCAAVAHATRRMLSVLPAITSVRAQLSSAAASLLVPGVVAYGLALAIVG